MAFSMTIGESAVWPPLPTMKELIEAATKKVDFITSVAILNGFDYEVNGITYHFSFGTEDQSNFIQESVRANMAVQNGTGDTYRAYWRGHTANGATTLEFNLVEFMALLTYCGTNKSNLLSQGWDTKAKLSACKTKVELKALVKELDLDAKLRAAKATYAELTAASEFADA